MRSAIALSILAIGVSAALAARPASAALVTQISYTVNGGTFGQGPGATAATGPITGGSVTVTLPGASGVSTVPSFFVAASAGRPTSS